MEWGLTYTLLIFPDFTVEIETFITALFSVEVINFPLDFLSVFLSTSQHSYYTEQGRSACTWTAPTVALYWRDELDGVGLST
jgi:hypothetical protein